MIEKVAKGRCPTLPTAGSMAPVAMGGRHVRGGGGGGGSGGSGGGSPGSLASWVTEAASISASFYKECRSLLSQVAAPQQAQQGAHENRAQQPAPRTGPIGLDSAEQRRTASMLAARRAAAVLGLALLGFACGASGRRGAMHAAHWQCLSPIPWPAVATCRPPPPPPRQHLPRSAAQSCRIVGCPPCAGALPAWYKCDCSARNNCQCPSIKPPGGLDPTDTPQFILLTHDECVLGWHPWPRSSATWVHALARLAVLSIHSAHA